MKNIISNQLYKTWFCRQSSYIQPIFKRDIEFFNKCNNRKSSSLIRKEMKFLQKYWNCIPFQYYFFDMFHKECKLTLDEMKDYIPYYFLSNLFWPNSYKKYHDMIKNKFLTHSLFNNFGELQARILCISNDGVFYNDQNDRIDDKEVNEILQQTNAGKLFLKPNKGSWGAGIIVFSKNDYGDYVNNNDEILCVEYIRKNATPGDFILQEGIIQSKTMSKLYPDSVNTIRIVTRCRNNEPEVMYTILKVGQGGAQVDNSAAGGLAVDVDKVTGRLAEKAYAYSLEQEYYTHHPDTGIMFKDYQLDRWDELLNFMKRNILKIRDIEYIGWDIALTESGPLIVELNASPEIDLIQKVYGGLRTDFDISPDEWFHKKNWYLNWKRI